MTFEMFMFLFTTGSVISGLFTQAMKRAYSDLSPNMMALYNALIVGIFGTLVSYFLMGIELTPPNIACLFLMSACIWLGSMVGYDKVKQTIEQLKR